MKKKKKKKESCNAGDPGSIPGPRRSPAEGIGYPPQYSCASLMAQLVKNPSAKQRTWVRSLGWEVLWRRERLPTPVFWTREFWAAESWTEVSDFHFHFCMKLHATGHISK